MTVPNELPKISIITPTYNQGQFIEQTITSILEQGYPNFEYIIIDGGSTDNTVEIIRKYEKYITYWVSEKDKGQSDAINKGLKKATGDIINWLNSDDYYMPGILQHVAAQFADPSVTCYGGRSRVFSPGKEYFSQGTDVYMENLEKSIGWARIDQPETFFHKRVWQKIRNVNGDFHYVMDKELWIRYLLNFGINGVRKDNKVLVNFRVHNQSKTGSQIEKFSEETIDLFYSLATFYDLPVANEFSKLKPVKQKPLFGYEQINVSVLERAIHYFFLHVALEAYAQNNYDLSKKAAALLDKEYIKPELEELNKVLLRMKVIPVIIKKAINYIQQLS